MADVVVVPAGTLDGDESRQWSPDIEYYVEERTSCLREFERAKQVRVKQRASE